MLDQRAFLLGVALLLSPATLAGAAALPGSDVVERAKRDFQQGKLEAALQALDDAEKGGRPAQALDLRGCIYLEQKKFAEARAAFQAAHEADRAIFAPRLHFGDALLREGKWDEARAAYEPLIKETNVLTSNERLRFAILLTHLGGKNEARAKSAFESVTFPTETPAYYYAQAAWAFAHGSKSAGVKWLRTADEIFDAKATAWFARPLYEMGWIKTKPPLSCE